MATSLDLSLLEADGSRRQESITPGTYYFGRDPGCHFVLTALDVSRRHVKIKFEDRGFLVEDLGSSSGTTANGLTIIGLKRFSYPQRLEIGSVIMEVAKAKSERPAVNTEPVEPPNGVTISVAMDASHHGLLPVGGIADEAAKRLEMLYDLPLQFAAEADLRKLYALILKRVMELIPGAKRGALLIIEPSSGKLALRASIPVDHPPVSRTLIKRAAEDQEGFIWGDDQMADSQMSIVQLGIRTGMYVPLLWKGQTVGVLCVDNPKNRAVFRREDLQFMIAVAQYAASAVANQHLQEDIEANNTTLQNLLGNFSPKLRVKLLQKSREGRLQPGGEKSVVTILMSDLRGFMATSAGLDSEVVMSMLNDYFAVLGNVIFQHDGTIDKFIGDAILAVFGSPEPDEHHALKAVQAGMQMQEEMKLINQRRLVKGLPVCALGIGIYTGEVLHGFIGAAERMEFTVIGDTVNRASRYCDGAGAGEIIIGDDTHEAVMGIIPARHRTIQTKHEGPVEAWVVG